MDKVAAGLLRWGVVLGLLVALPAFALRDKWDDFAAIFVEQSAAAEVVTTGGFTGSTLQFDAAKPPTGLKSPEMIPIPGRLDHSESPGDGHLHNAAAHNNETPKSARMRDLRTCVYRPLSSGDDQKIQRIPATTPGVENHTLR